MFNNKDFNPDNLGFEEIKFHQSKSATQDFIDRIKDTKVLSLYNLYVEKFGIEKDSDGSKSILSIMADPKFNYYASYSYDIFNKAEIYILHGSPENAHHDAVIFLKKPNGWKPVGCLDKSEYILNPLGSRFIMRFPRLENHNTVVTDLQGQTVTDTFTFWFPKLQVTYNKQDLQEEV